MAGTGDTRGTNSRKKRKGQQRKKGLNEGVEILEEEDIDNRDEEII